MKAGDYFTIRYHFNQLTMQGDLLEHSDGARPIYQCLRINIA
jgi:hypothetical protein